MSHAISSHNDILVVQAQGALEHMKRQYGGWHASAPVLLALSLVVIVASMVAILLMPAALGILLVGMTILMIGAAGLAFFSLYATGEVLEARFDRSREVAVLLYRGLFAHTEWAIPLNRITGARMAMRYDDNGNKIATPMLELKNGRTIVLPASTTWSDIEAIRTLVTSQIDVAAQAWAKKTNSRPEAYARMRRPGSA